MIRRNSSFPTRARLWQHWHRTRAPRISRAQSSSCGALRHVANLSLLFSRRIEKLRQQLQVVIFSKHSRTPVFRIHIYIIWTHERFKKVPTTNIESISDGTTSLLQALIAPHRPTNLFSETVAEPRMNVRLMAEDKRKAANLFSPYIQLNRNKQNRFLWKAFSGPQRKR